MTEVITKVLFTVRFTNQMAKKMKLFVSKQWQKSPGMGLLSLSNFENLHQKGRILWF